MQEENNLMTVRQAAEFTGLAEKTIYKKLAEGSIPCRRLGRTIRFLKPELMAAFKPRATKAFILGGGEAK